MELFHIVFNAKIDWIIAKRFGVDGYPASYEILAMYGCEEECTGLCHRLSSSQRRVSCIFADRVIVGKIQRRKVVPIVFDFRTIGHIETETFENFQLLLTVKPIQYESVIFVQCQ